MITFRFILAVLLSGGMHAGGVCLCVLECWPWSVHDTPPELIEAFGDSDREGFDVGAVAVDAGTYRQGDLHTPGGDDAPEKLPDAAVGEVDLSQPVAIEAKLTAPTIASLPAALPGPATLDNTTKTGLPGAPGGANMAIGTPSRGGIVGSASGVKMRSSGRKVYPAEAARLGQEGTVVVRIRISEEGDVVEAKLDKSSGFPLLDEAGVRYARTMKFRPAYRDGTPVECTTKAPIIYELPN